MEEQKANPTGRELTNKEFDVAMDYCRTTADMYEKGEISDDTLGAVGTQLLAYERYIDALKTDTPEELFDLKTNWIDKRLKQKEEQAEQ